MHAKSFNISVQGASHIKKNKECQDASRSYYNNDIAIAVVCDGHGGSDYVRSAVGS
jgi:serine/threonine protein phosphatase PrpC